MKEAQKEWWKSFFKPITSEVMFRGREGKQTVLEAEEVLRACGLMGNLKILDLACGEGRHSVEFARRGHLVSGLDYTKGFIDEGRRRARAAKLDIEFVRGDMKLTSKYFEAGSFDLVVSLYNSFGFFAKRSDDRRTLREASKVLRPGGILILNTINGNGAKARLARPVQYGYELKKNVFLIDHASLDLKKMRTTAHWTIVDARKPRAEITRGSFAQNIYTHQEVKALLKRAGFRVLRTWGVLQGGAFDEKTSWHQTVVAQKISKKRPR